jgi:hypothetical protein
MTAVVSDAWRKLEKVTFCQPWMMWVEGEGGVKTWQLRGTGRAVLNQDYAGAQTTVSAQIAEILAAGAAALSDGQTLAGVPPLTLPYVEIRDLSCAQAIVR